ncbi:DUF1643 domain-containing protein [Amycolatopsis sp. CA-128772]|uniref:DUF1643 domain-containing protein n=1 Tax=Amycolatopsis sp. CA-128772 TaxID=2073159 RepID=UPI0018ED500A|nr:DUF1643 domain-containing protein [Amycolatopsis sp. CA-128772]
MLTLPPELTKRNVVQESGNLFESAFAVLDPTGNYRYLLTRTWAPGPLVMFVMLNPSTADAVTDDPTMRRVERFARSWGFGGLAVVNLFALRATDPAVVESHPDPVGPDTDVFLAATARQADRCVAAWGAHPAAQRRAPAVARVLARAATRQYQPGLACLGLTKGRGAAAPAVPAEDDHVDQLHRARRDGEVTTTETYPSWWNVPGHMLTKTALVELEFPRTCDGRAWSA